MIYNHDDFGNGQYTLILDLAPYSVRMLNNWCVKPKEGFKNE